MPKIHRSDNHPRFGWTSTIDRDPEIIWGRHGAAGLLKDEKKTKAKPIPVVVIPLPFMSTGVRTKIRMFTNGILWPKD